MVFRGALCSFAHAPPSIPLRSLFVQYTNNTIQSPLQLPGSATQHSSHFPEGLPLRLTQQLASALVSSPTAVPQSQQSAREEQ